MRHLVISSLILISVLFVSYFRNLYYFPKFLSFLDGSVGYIIFNVIAIFLLQAVLIHFYVKKNNIDLKHNEVSKKLKSLWKLSLIYIKKVLKVTLRILKPNRLTLCVFVILVLGLFAFSFKLLNADFEVVPHSYLLTFSLLAPELLFFESMITSDSSFMPLGFILIKWSFLYIGSLIIFKYLIGRKKEVTNV